MLSVEEDKNRRRGIGELNRTTCLGTLTGLVDDLQEESTRQIEEWVNNAGLFCGLLIAASEGRKRRQVLLRRALRTHVGAFVVST